MIFKNPLRQYYAESGAEKIKGQSEMLVEALNAWRIYPVERLDLADFVAGLKAFSPPKNRGRRSRRDHSTI